MERNTSTTAELGSPANPIPLPKDKKQLLAYYGGERLPSPMGGQLDVLGVREGEGGVGRVLLECNVSSLRYVLTVPKATRGERAAVKAAIEEGEELNCPRHGDYHRLIKSGKSWACQECGVPYAKWG